jgi:hypothetical protein
MMEGSGKVLATRDIDEMRAALAAGDQQRFSKHCRRIEQELTAGEHVVLLASCVSGKPALLAITNQRTLFVFKPDAITPMKVVARRLDEYDSVYAVASDVVNLHRPGQQVVGFQQLRPPIADQIAAHVWDALGLRPEATPTGLPTHELGVVTRVLEPYAKAPLDEPRPDGDETIDVAWFTTDQFPGIALSEFTIALLGDPAVAILGHGSAHRIES